MNILISNLKMECLNNKLVDFLSDCEADIQLHNDNRSNKITGLDIYINCNIFTLEHTFEEDFWDGETSLLNITVIKNSRKYSLSIEDKMYDTVGFM